MKTLYGKLKVPKLLRLPALIVLLLALSYTAWSQSSNSPVCYGQPILLDCSGGVTGAVCGDATAQFSWSHPSGWQSQGQSPSINFGELVTIPPNVGNNAYQNGVYSLTVRTGAPGTYTYTTGQVSVSFNFAGVAPISGTQTVCSGTPSATYTTTTGQNNYSWTVSRSAGATPTISGTSTASTVIVNWGTATVTTYGYVNVSYTDANGCLTTSTTYTITIYPLPSSTVTGPNSACVNAAGNVYSITGVMSSYLWNITVGGGIAAAGLTSPTVSVTWPTAGIASVTVYYTDANGCSATSAAKTTTVNPIPTAPVFTPASGTGVCTLAGNVYTVTSFNPAYTYAWTVAGPTGTTPTSGSTGTITVGWGAPGTGTITCQATALGCSSAITTNTYTMAPVATAVITGPAFACLAGGSATASYTVSAAGATSFAWSITGGTGSISSGQNTATLTVSWTAGPGTVSVVAYNAYCSSVATATTAVGSNPTPTVTGLTTVCQGAIVQYYTEPGMDLYDWVVTSDPLLSLPTVEGQGTSTITVTWGTNVAVTTPVTGVVMVSVRKGGCSGSSAALNITIGAPISLNAISGPSPVCEFTGGNLYGITPAMDTYQWTVVGPSTTTITSGQHTQTITVFWGGSGPYTGTVNVQVTRLGCAATGTERTIIINDTPAVPAISGASTVCTNLPAAYSVSNSTGLVYYNWTVTGSYISFTGQGTNNFNVIWGPCVGDAPSPCVGYVSVAVSNLASGTCMAYSVVKTVTINPLPTPTVDGPTAVCAGSTGNKYVTQAGMTGYTWTVLPAGSYSIIGATNTNSITVTWNTSGARSVSVNYTNANGCTATLTTPFNVLVNPLPVPVITAYLPIPAAKVCVGDVTTFSTAASMTNYLWTIVNSVGSITTSNVNNSINVTYDVPGTWTISVAYTDGNGCTANPATTTVITVLDVPAPVIEGQSASCLNTPGVVYTAQPGFATYDWNVTGGNATFSGDGTQTITVNWTGPGSTGYTGVVTLATSNGTCTGTTSKNVAVGTLPVPQVTGHTQVCEFTGGHVYSVSVLNATNWAWNVIGPPNTAIQSGDGTATITVYWAQANVVTGTSVYVTVTNNVRCQGTSPVLPVAIMAPPAVYTITGARSTCTAIDQTYSLYGSPTVYNYKWTVTSGGTIVGTTTSSSFTVRWNGPGASTGQVGVSYSNINPAYGDAESCRKFAPDYSVTVNARPIPEITGDSPVCEGNVKTYYTASGMTSYNWTIDAGTGGSYVYKTGVESTSATVTVTWGSAGIHTMTVYYWDANGCEATRTTAKGVTVKVQPTAPVINGDSIVCALTNGSVYSTPFVNSDFKYVWSVTNGTITSATNTTRTITVNWGSVNPGTVSLIVTNASLCVASNVKTVTINPLPTPTVTGPGTVCAGIYANYDTEPGMLEYTWIVTGGGNTTITVGQFTKSITVYWDMPSPGAVKVFVKNVYGCLGSSATKVVTIDPTQPTISNVDNFEFCGYPGDLYDQSTWHVFTAGNSAAGDYVWDVVAGDERVVSYTTLVGQQVVKVLYATNTSTTVWTDLYVKVSYTGNCGSSLPVTEYLTINPIPQPVVHGVDLVCQSECQNIGGIVYGAHTYSTAWVNGNTYQWSVSGGIIISGENTNTITVCWTTCPEGTLQVTETNIHGCVTNSDVFTVTIMPKPAPVISGPLTVNTNETAVYSTPVHGNNLYTWTVVGGTIVSGQGTNAITVDWGPMPACWCGTVQVCESTVGQGGVVLCTGCDQVNIDLLPSDHSINGYISYKNGYGTKLNGVEVVLRNHSTGAIVAETQTGPNMVGPPAELGLPGYFAFVNIPLGTVTETIDYDLSALELGPDNPWGGNNATDALLVQLHITSNDYPLDPLNHTVADVNGSTTITSLDALHILLRTVGLVNYYPAGDWKFDAKHVILSGSPKTEDLNGLCVGDVNGSYVPSGMKAASLLSSIEDGVQTVPVNASFTYDLRSNAVAGLGAMTLFMSYDESKFEIEKVSTVLEGMKYTIGNGLISLAWSDTRTLDVKSNDVVISLQMKAKSPITEATEVFALQAGSEFADAIAQPFENFELKMAKVVTTGNSAFSLQNYPNPFKNSTDIVYTLPETGTVTLIVTDMLGKTVSTLVNGETQNAGTYRLTVNAADGKMNPGVYLYRIQVEGANASFVKTNKMTVTH